MNLKQQTYDVVVQRTQEIAEVAKDNPETTIIIALIALMGQILVPLITWLLMSKKK